MRQETLNEMLNFLTVMEDQLEEENVSANKRRALTTSIMKTALALLVVLALVNGYFLFQLSEGLDTNLTAANSMSQGFSDIATHMHVISDDVVAMSEDVQHLNTINADVSLMATSMGAMASDIQLISDSMTAVDLHMYGFDKNLSNMERDVVFLSGDVRGVSQSMDKMATPMKVFNSFMPW